MKHSLSLVLLVCLISPAHANGLGPTKSIFSSYSSSVLPAPSLRGSVIALGARWPSMAKGKTTTPAMTIERGLIEAGDFGTSAYFAASLGFIKEGALNDAAELLKTRKEAAKYTAKGMAEISARYKSVGSKNASSALAEGRRKIDAELRALDQQAERAAKTGGFLSKLGTALEILDFVSVAAQGAGYLVEGDTTGAAGVVANEVAKKASEGVGALVTSFVPGGPIAGSWAGSKAWEKYLKPVIDKREQDLREAELARATLNKPWLVSKSFIDSTGRVRDLEDDQYVERGTGLVRRRTAEEQAGFEHLQHMKWLNQKAMAQVEQDYADGKIDKAKLVELQISYQGRSLVEVWKPLGYSTPFSEAWDTEEDDDDADEGTAATETPTEADARDVVSAVPPIALGARGSFSESFEGWDDIVRTFEFAFWNLGAFSPGHEQAVLKVTSSYDGEAFSLIGRFSGGPNGTLTFTDDEGETRTFRLQGGTHLIAELERLVENGTEIVPITLTMPLSNPNAFDGWPANLR